MSINKRYLPELPLLKEELFKTDSDTFYKRYVSSPDALIGPVDSLEFIEEFAREYEN